MGTLEVIVQEAAKVKIILPNVCALKEALTKAKDWCQKVDKVQVLNRHLLECWKHDLTIECIYIYMVVLVIKK